MKVLVIDLSVVFILSLSRDTDIKKRYPHTQTLVDKHPPFYCFVSTPLQTPIPITLMMDGVDLDVSQARADLLPDKYDRHRISVALAIGGCPAGTTRGR